MPYPRVILRNTTADSATDLNDGELLITTLKGKEGLWTKNSNNTIVKIGYTKEQIDEMVKKAFEISGCTCGDIEGGIVTVH